MQPFILSMVVQTVDSAIHCLIHYQVNSSVCFVSTYLVVGDLFGLALVIFIVVSLL